LAERLGRACLRGGWNKVVKNLEGSQAAKSLKEQEREREREKERREITKGERG